MKLFLLTLCVWYLWLTSGMAEQGSGALFAARQPLYPAQNDARLASAKASLFIDTGAGSLFADLPARFETPIRQGRSQAARLRDLIARVEAGQLGYDAVQHGAHIKPPKRPTQMTLAEIFDWIDATPGQPHAIGRYQFIPATLRHSAKRLSIPHSARFSPAIQDRLADLLLGDAGLHRAQTGKISNEAFMLNLAKIWAGLPTSSGRSYYEGFAGNKAVISYADYARQVRRIFES